MPPTGDRNLHLIMGVLLGLSLFVDQQEFVSWRAGHVSMVSLVLGLVWIGRSSWEGLRRRESELQTLRDRVREAEAKIDELVADARRRRTPF